MSNITLAIAPNTNATLTVLGVTASQIVLAGQDGKTEAVAVGTYLELDKAKAGDIVTLVGSDTANTYLIKSVEAPAAAKKAAQSSGRPCNARVAADMRNDI